MGVFGRLPDDEDEPTDGQKLFGNKQAVGNKIGSGLSPASPTRRRSETICEGRGGTATTMSTPAPTTGGLDGGSNFGDGIGSSSEEGEEGGGGEQGGQAVGAAGFDLPDGGVGTTSDGRGGAVASASAVANTPVGPLAAKPLSTIRVGATGKEAGRGKKVGVRAMITRRLRSRKGKSTDGVPTEEVAATVAAEEARGNSLSSRSHNRSPSPSSSSSLTSVLGTRPPPTPDVAMRTPAGLWINRHASSENEAEETDRRGALGGGGDGGGGGAGSTGGGTGNGDKTLLLELLGATGERAARSRRG